MRRVVAVPALLVCLAAVGGCGGSLEPREPVGPGVTGRMIAVDDTGLPPTADGGGGILAIPGAALPDLWRRVGLDAPAGPEHLAHTRFPTDTGLVADLGAEVAPVDADGHFRLSVTGPHLLCRLRADVTEGAPPASTSGCEVVELPASAALTASVGEAGFNARVEESLSP